MPLLNPENGTPLQWKLWLYTNYHCNLRCSYCVARSAPDVAPRLLPVEAMEVLVDEAVALDFERVFFTGGEPFLLPYLTDILAYATERLPATVLTNAMLLRGSRLEKLKAIKNDNLSVQVSLDGGRAEDHDAYRGEGTWQKTVDGIYTLLDEGFHVCLSTTETPANTESLHLVHEFRDALGIPADDHFIRPLAKRGFSSTGIKVDMETLVPEVTASVEGIFWHPLSTDHDMKVSDTLFPLSDAIQKIEIIVERMISSGKSPELTFT